MRPVPVVERGFQLERFARPAGLVILAAVTLFGVHQFLVGDWGRVSEHWRSQLWLIPIILLLACLDVALEGIGWSWVYERFGIRVGRAGLLAYLAGRAGLLLPAQLGRLIRPDAMARLGRGPLRECLKAEAVSFVLDAASVLALVAGLVAYRLHPLAAPLAALGTVGGILLFGNLVANRVVGTRILLPPALWWSWQTWAIVLIQMAGWAANGLALWMMIRGLPGSRSLVDVLLFSAGSAVLGVGSGLPGGIGATELLLGISLRVGEVPADHLFVVIGAFRVVTFWIWIPVGWIALLWTQRRSPAAAETSAGEELADGKRASQTTVA